MMRKRKLTHKHKRIRSGKEYEFYIQELDIWLTLDEIADHPVNIERIPRATIKERIKRVILGDPIENMETFYKCIITQRHETFAKNRPFKHFTAIDLMNKALLNRGRI